MILAAVLTLEFLISFNIHNSVMVKFYATVKMYASSLAITAIIADKDSFYWDLYLYKSVETCRANFIRQVMSTNVSCFKFERMLVAINRMYILSTSDGFFHCKKYVENL